MLQYIVSRSRYRPKSLTNTLKRFLFFLVAYDNTFFISRQSYCRLQNSFLPNNGTIQSKYIISHIYFSIHNFYIIRVKIFCNQTHIFLSPLTGPTSNVPKNLLIGKFFLHIPIILFLCPLIL